MFEIFTIESYCSINSSNIISLIIYSNSYRSNIWSSLVSNWSIRFHTSLQSQFTPALYSARYNESSVIKSCYPSVNSRNSCLISYKIWSLTSFFISYFFSWIVFYAPYIYTSNSPILRELDLFQSRHLNMCSHLSTVNSGNLYFLVMADTNSSHWIFPSPFLSISLKAANMSSFFHIKKLLIVWISSLTPSGSCLNLASASPSSHGASGLKKLGSKMFMRWRKALKLMFPDVPGAYIALVKMSISLLERCTPTSRSSFSQNLFKGSQSLLVGKTSSKFTQLFHISQMISDISIPGSSIAYLHKTFCL